MITKSSLLTLNLYIFFDRDPEFQFYDGATYTMSAYK